MELELERRELTSVQTTARKTMRLLPKGKKRQQQVVVGDQSGALICFGMKKDHLEQTFKTPPLEKEVSRIELVGYSITLISFGMYQYFRARGA